MRIDVYDDGVDRIVVDNELASAEIAGEGGCDTIVVIARFVKMKGRWQSVQELPMFLSTWRKIVAHWAEGTEDNESGPTRSEAMYAYARRIHSAALAQDWDAVSAIRMDLERDGSALAVAKDEPSLARKDLEETKLGPDNA